MEPHEKEEQEREQLERVDSSIDSDLAYTSSGVSTIFTAENCRSFSSSGDVSSLTSGSSGEIPVDVVVEESYPRLLDTAFGDLTVTGTAAARRRCVGKHNREVTWGFTAVTGRRKEMEDAVAVIPAFMSHACGRVGGCLAPGSRTSGEISPLHFFGVYDGHGGSQVAKFCAERMHEMIAEEWDRATTASGLEWQKKWKEAFANGFERADNEVLTEAAAPEIVGSTAVVVVLSGCQIITSNCGDSRAVLCRGTQTIPLSVDQKPDRDDELMRIEREGGKVINWNGARVLGVLSMSRAIGDRYLRPWIICVPEITFTARGDEDECLIVASDGLWDVMTNEEAGEVSRRLLRRHRRQYMAAEGGIWPAQAVADALTEIAYSRNSSDNISVIVVDLKTKKSSRHQRQ